MEAPTLNELELLCVGCAAYDITYHTPTIPDPGSKAIASSVVTCGGGPASNAAVTAARLGIKSGFCGYLGSDSFGDLHFGELKADGVNTDLVVRGKEKTQLSATITNEDGESILVSYIDVDDWLTSEVVQFREAKPKVLLFDGREPHLIAEMIEWAAEEQITTVLDAGSPRPIYDQILSKVDYVVASRNCARRLADTDDLSVALEWLCERCDNSLITLGADGLVWQTKVAGEGSLETFKVDAIDSIGAGDAFHGAFCAGLVKQLPWDELVRFASAAGALTTTGLGGRTSIPTLGEVHRLIKG